MIQPLLEVRDLKKYFPVRAGIFRRQVATVKAVDGLDLTILPGQIVGLVGESGCGKSTAARTIIGLFQPTSGHILYEGKDLKEMTMQQMDRFRQDVAIVFQDPMLSLNPRMTIHDSLGEPLYYHGRVTNPVDLTRQVETILEQVGLSARVMTRYPHEFSGGQLQRICIGRAIALQPKLIVLDEAVSALDISVQGQILNLLVDLQQRLGFSYLFIAHDLSVVRYLCDEVVVMYLGKVMESASSDDLFRHPRHPYTQVLLSAVPRVDPDAKTQRTILKGELPSSINPPSGCPFRTRCPYAQPICAETPPRKIVDEDHRYDCIL